MEPPTWAGEAGAAPAPVGLSRVLAGLVRPVGWVAVGLAVATFEIQALRLSGVELRAMVTQVDLRVEGNFATWFSSALILLVAASCGLLGWTATARARFSFWTRWLYRLAAAGFLYLSVDEVAMLHEQAGTKFAESVGIDSAAGALPYGMRWVVLYAPVAMFGGFCLWRLTRTVVRALPAPGLARGTRPMLAVGIAALFAVLGCETAESYIHRAGGDTSLLTCLEESLELVGFYSLFVVHARLARAHDM